MRSVLARLGGTLVIIAIVFSFIAGEDIIASFSKPVDIYVDYPEDVYDVKAVETDIYELDGIFAEEEITSDSSTSIYYYYVMPVYTADEDIYYVGVKVNKKNCKPYDKVVDSTVAYWNYETDELTEYVHFTGAFTEMEDELYDYFTESLEGYFESDADLEKYALPLVLEPMVFKNVKSMLFVIIGMVVAGALMLFFAFRPAKQAAASRPVITINGVNYPSSNFESVNKMVKKGETANAVKELQRLTGVQIIFLAATV